MTLNKWTKLVLSLLLCLVVGLIATWFTNQTIETWYPKLIKPSWTPPRWVFPLIWTILYLMIAFSFWIVWSRQGEPVSAPDFFTWFAFGTQLFLNALWPYLFFYLKNPILGFLDIVLLWTAIIVNFACFWNYSKLSAYLIIPYWLWVTYALALNFRILMLNPSI
jgi:benzodiazapine receptor